MQNPDHPGVMLKKLYLEPLELGWTEAAEGLGVTPQVLSDLIDGRIGISPEMALRLEKAFGTSREVWLTMQQRFELAQAEHTTDLSNVQIFTEEIRHLEYLDRRDTIILDRILHEVNSPLLAIRSTVYKMRRELEEKGIIASSFFRHDYLYDLWACNEEMFYLLRNYSICLPHTEIKIQASYVNLVHDVIEPVVKQVGLLLKKRKFSTSQIIYATILDNIPSLLIDRDYFKQLFFNLLCNSIKFSYKDPKSFQIQIKGIKNSNEILLVFRDWGRGVSNNLREVIFEEGFRGIEGMKYNISGHGLGLWVVRLIVEAHGGQVRLTNDKFPTEVTISLPAFRCFKPPV